MYTGHITLNIKNKAAENTLKAAENIVVIENPEKDIYIPIYTPYDWCSLYPSIIQKGEDISRIFEKIQSKPYQIIELTQKINNFFENYSKILEEVLVDIKQVDPVCVNNIQWGLQNLKKFIEYSFDPGMNNQTIANYNFVMDFFECLFLCKLLFGFVSKKHPEFYEKTDEINIMIVWIMHNICNDPITINSIENIIMKNNQCDQNALLLTSSQKIKTSEEIIKKSQIQIQESINKEKKLLEESFRLASELQEKKQKILSSQHIKMTESQILPAENNENLNEIESIKKELKEKKKELYEAQQCIETLRSKITEKSTTNEENTNIVFKHPSDLDTELQLTKMKLSFAEQKILEMEQSAKITEQTTINQQSFISEIEHMKMSIHELQTAKEQEEQKVLEMMRMIEFLQNENIELKRYQNEFNIRAVDGLLNSTYVSELNESQMIEGDSFQKEKENQRIDPKEMNENNNELMGTVYQGYVNYQPEEQNPLKQEEKLQQLIETPQLQQSTQKPTTEEKVEKSIETPQLQKSIETPQLQQSTQKPTTAEKIAKKNTKKAQK